MFVGGVDFVMDEARLPKEYPLPEQFKGIPYSYQYQGSAFLYAVERGLLGDVTGAGKTIQALLACALVQLKQIPRPKVLVCTVNSAVLQWKSEIKRFLPGWRPIVVSAEYTPWDRREIVLGAGNKDIVIMNYSIMRNDTTREKIKKTGEVVKTLGWMEKASWDIIIFDEAAAFKNYQSELFKAAKLTATKAKYVWALTAYAMSNNPMEVFGIYSVMRPKVFGVEYVDKQGITHEYLGATRFKNIFTSQREIRTQRGGRMMVYAGGKNLGTLKNKIDSSYLGRNYSDLGSELPGLIEKKVIIQLEKFQRKAYTMVEDGLLGKIKVEDVLGIPKVTQMPSPQNILVQMIHLQKITNGLRFWDPKIAAKYDENPKLDEIKRMLDSEFEGEKVVIFSKFRTYIDILEKELAEYHPVRITGAETQEQREYNKIAFSDPKSKVKVLLMTRAGGYGLNLQAARVIMLVDSPFSFGELGQIVGRIRRIGSKHSHALVVYFAAEDTFDDHVLDVLKGKKKTIEAVFGNKDLMGDIEEVDANVFESLLTRRVQDKKRKK